MPELPEVETIKRELEKTVLGKRICRVVINNPRVIREPKPPLFVSSLEQSSIRAIIRKGKLLIMELSTGKALAIHLKMTGQLLYPGKGKESRVSIVFSDGTMLDFNDRRLFGELRVVDDWRDLKFVQELGPEPFDVTVDDFKQLLAGKRTKIKPLLLDQTFLSGIGNLYAAEALFRARIHPERPAASLSAQEAERLFKEIRDTLAEAIRYKGSSVDQYVQLSGEQGSYVSHHKVYDREGKACTACGAPIARSTVGGRGTYFCPRCQK